MPASKSKRKKVGGLVRLGKKSLGLGSNTTIRKSKTKSRKSKLDRKSKRISEMKEALRRWTGEAEEAEHPGEHDEEEEEECVPDPPESVQDAQKRLELPPDEVPCSFFFQQAGTLNFEHFLRLKREEKIAVRRYRAAQKIQAAWRGFITRYKMKILHLAAQKIQAYIRGFLARRLVGRLLAEKRARDRARLEEEAAIKIQAWWRGILSRRNKFDFKEYKKIQCLNNSLNCSIDKINRVESAINGESDVPSLSDMLNMDEGRLAELLAWLNKCVWDGKDYPKRVPSLKIREFRLDSVSDMFRFEFPDDGEGGFIKPDPNKVQALIDAIRLLRNEMERRELQNLQKQHHLLRTQAQPGVYSDIYCNKLTEIEKQLKALKFYEAPPDPRVKVKKASSTRPNTRISNSMMKVEMSTEEEEAGGASGDEEVARIMSTTTDSTKPNTVAQKRIQVKEIK